MTWLNVSFVTTEKQAESFAEYLFTAGACAVNFENFHSNDVFEPKPNELKLWEKTKVIGLFEENSDIKVINFILYQLLPKEEKSTITTTSMANQDWINTWLEDCEPLKFNNLYICPDKVVDKNAINVLLRPGVGFGSGRHPTTFLCLSWISKNNFKDKTLIDYGCGSGILGISAAKLNAQVHCIDYDKQALSATKENMLHNEVNIKCYLPDEFNITNADYLVANILLEPLLELKYNFAAFLKQNATLVMSGILDTQKEKLILAYEELFYDFKIETKESWCLIICKKK